RDPKLVGDSQQLKRSNLSATRKPPDSVAAASPSLGADVPLAQTAPQGFGRSLNVAGLVVGLGLGQGLLFLSQTWLVHNGHLAFLGQFGAWFAFGTLGIFLVDMGAATSLARRVAAPTRTTDLRQMIWAAYAPATAVRLAMGGAVVVAGL